MGEGRGGKTGKTRKRGDSEGEGWLGRELSRGRKRKTGKEEEGRKKGRGKSRERKRG